MHPFEPIHISVAGRPDDPRRPMDVPEGVVVHYVPELHPDDVTVVDGIPTTTIERTLIDLAETEDLIDLLAVWTNAWARGMVDPDALLAARARVEWRPSLTLVDALIDEFCG
jgi:hypothetical protein